MIDASEQSIVRNALSGIFTIAIGTCERFFLGMYSLVSCAMLAALKDSSAMPAGVCSFHLDACS
jgi:hypothetical protein